MGPQQLRFAQSFVASLSFGLLSWQAQHLERVEIHFNNAIVSSTCCCLPGVALDSIMTSIMLP